MVCRTPQGSRTKLMPSARISERTPSPIDVLTGTPTDIEASALIAFRAPATFDMVLRPGWQVTTAPALRPLFLAVPPPKGFARPLHGGGWKVFLLEPLRSKSLGKLYAGPGLSPPTSGADIRWDRIGGRVGQPLFPTTLAHPSLTSALLAAVEIAFVTAVALLHLGGGPANVVPHFIVGRTQYSPGPGVSFPAPAPLRVSSRSRYLTSRKPIPVARSSHECTGPRRSEDGRRPENSSRGGPQSVPWPTCIGPTFVARSPHA